MVQLPADVRMRILAVAERAPRMDESAGDRRLGLLLAALARRHQVDLWTERSPARPLPDGVAGLGPGWAGLQASLSGASYDLVFYEFFFAAERYGAAVAARQAGARIVIDSVDVHFARLAAGVAVGAHTRREAEAMRRREIRAYRAADAVVVASREDGQALASAAPGVRTILAGIPAVVTPRRAGPREEALLFVGGFDHAPNRDAVRWFVDACWPAVRRDRPRARLLVAGSRMRPDVAALGRVAGVEVLGRVGDLTGLLDRVAVSIAPLRYGAGMKGKVVDAMAAGVPVVTTRVGAQGLDVRPGEHLVVADGAGAFAAAVTALLGDPAACERIGVAGQAVVARSCDGARVGEDLRRALDDLVREARPVRPPAPARFLPVARARAAHEMRRLRLRVGSLIRPGGGAAS